MQVDNGKYVKRKSVLNYDIQAIHALKGNEPTNSTENNHNNNKQYIYILQNDASPSDAKIM